MVVSLKHQCFCVLGIDNSFLALVFVAGKAASVIFPKQGVSRLYARSHLPNFYRRGGIPNEQLEQSKETTEIVRKLMVRMIEIVIRSEAGGSASQDYEHSLC